MRTLRNFVGSLVVVGLSLIGPALARADAPPLIATLTRAQVVPQSEALPTGSGFLRILLGSDTGIICFSLYVSNLPGFPPPEGSYFLRIRKGLAGSVGPTVATYSPIVKLLTGRCISGLSASLISDLFTNPEDYYAEVVLPDPNQAGAEAPERLATPLARSAASSDSRPGKRQARRLPRYRTLRPAAPPVERRPAARLP